MFFFFKQKTAYEMRISDWSADVCSSDLWSQTQKLVVPAPHRAAGELFGFSVALDKNVQYLVVGAPRDRHNLDEVSNPIVNAGSAYVYKLAGSGSPWNAFFLQKLVASDRAYQGEFGFALGITVTGNTNVPHIDRKSTRLNSSH